MILLILTGLTGLGALIGILIDLGKRVGLVKDGTAGNWSAGLNLAAFVAVMVVVMVGKQPDWGMVDGYLQMGVYILGFVAQMLGSQVTHAVTKKTVVGYSFSSK